MSVKIQGFFFCFSQSAERMAHLLAHLSERADLESLRLVTREKGDLFNVTHRDLGIDFTKPVVCE